MRTIHLSCALAIAVFITAPLPAGAVGKTTLDQSPQLKSESTALRFAACVTDDGYGRTRPCSAGGGYYKKSNKKKASK
jgi:hypothetical protein